MKHELDVFLYPHNLRSRAKLIRRFPDMPILSHNKDIHQFVDAVFDEVSSDTVYVRPNNGTDPYFETRNLHEDYPFTATYNAWGRTAFRATVLDQKLKEHYDANYPEPTEQALVARRLLGSYALTTPNIDIFAPKDVLGVHTGIIVPQIPDGPYIVHHIQPLGRGAKKPHGSYLQLVVPADTDEAREKLRSEGFTPLQEHA